MTPNLTDDLRQAIEERGGRPVYLLDASTNTRYVLLRAEQFEKVKALFGEDSEERDFRAMYPLVEESFRKAGWDDPEMDSYNDYDAHRPKS
jgi:hypothetical protein